MASFNIHGIPALLGTQHSPTGQSQCYVHLAQNSLDLDVADLPMQHCHPVALAKLQPGHINKPSTWSMRAWATSGQSPCPLLQHWFTTKKELNLQDDNITRMIHKFIQILYLRNDQHPAGHGVFIHRTAVPQDPGKRPNTIATSKHG